MCVWGGGLPDTSAAKKLKHSCPLIGFGGKSKKLVFQVLVRVRVSCLADGAYCFLL